MGAHRCRKDKKHLKNLGKATRSFQCSSFPSSDAVLAHHAHPCPHPLVTTQHMERLVPCQVPRRMTDRLGVWSTIHDTLGQRPTRRLGCAETAVAVTVSALPARAAPYGPSRFAEPSRPLCYDASYSPAGRGEDGQSRTSRYRPAASCAGGAAPALARQGTCQAPSCRALSLLSC